MYSIHFLIKSACITDGEEHFITSALITGMVKVKPGYQNVTEVKGALKSRGDSVKGKIPFL